MAEIVIRDFSAGWVPGDDPINGRRNGLLHMDNVELDSNGALTLQGGTSVKFSGFGGNAHTLYSRLINGARHDYSLMVNGSIFRDSTNIGTGGDTTNGAFGTAFNFTLIASGNKRLKDSGSGAAVNLGILPPTFSPHITQSALNAPIATIGDISTHTVTPVGSSTYGVIGSTPYLQMTATTGTCVVQTTGVAASDCSVLQGVGGSSNIGYQTDDDLVIIQGYTPTPVNETLKVDILLQPGDGSGNPVSDYFTTILDLGTLTFDPYTGVFTAAIRRADFERIGSKAVDWSTVYGFRLTYVATALHTINILASYLGTTQIYISGGSRAQFGTYQYAQVNVNNTGSYIAKSVLGVLSNPVVINANQALITPQDPTSVDSQCNEAWIYRKGGLLDQWYRVKVFTAGTFATPAYDTLGDEDALVLNLTLNLNLISINSGGVTDKIYDIIGPVNGRWYYFTTNFMYPSDINNPDLVDASIAIRICGSSSELFMWARQINDTTVLVGTSSDVYTLAGTFQTFPDFSVDIFYKPLHCKYPPLTCDVDVWAGACYYLANDGWRIIDGSGANPSLVSPNLDRLYRGETLQGYNPPNLKIVPRSTRFPFVIAKNKMWCFITGIVNPRIEIYDFIRKYWRVSNYALGDVSAATSTPDGQVIAFYATDKTIREIDIQSSKLIDGTTKQLPDIKTLVFDGDTPHLRKDSETIKLRIQNSDSFLVSIVVDGSVTVNNVANASANSIVKEQLFDLSQLANVALVKTYQLLMGTAVSDLVIDEICISYEARPEQRTFLRVQSNNYGTTARKRLYSIPFQVDTLGNTVNVTPIVDGSAKTPLAVSSTRKQSFDYQFSLSGSDVSTVGVDYEYTLLAASGAFEFFGFEQPRNIETFPAKQLSYVIPATNFDSAARKRLRMWPFVIDTFSSNVTFTPLIDGVPGTPVTFNTSGKQIAYLYETADVIGVEFSGSFSGTTAFELWEVMQPKQIEVFPEPVKFFVIPVTNFGKPQRKRVRNWPFVINTLGHDVTFTPVVDGVDGTAVTINTTDKSTYQYTAPADLIGTDWSGRFSGANTFELWDVIGTEDAEIFPPLEKVHVIPITNFGTNSRKRLRNWPFIIDTRGGTVTFTPIIDGVNGTPVNFTNSKQTVYVFETAEAIGTDFNGTFTSTTPFELWEAGVPKQIEVFPEPIRFLALPTTNYGSTGRKRCRMWPFEIDTRGGDVIFTPIIDGVNQPTATFNTGGTIATCNKKTVYAFETTDAIGVDFTGTFVGAAPFEFWS